MPTRRNVKRHVSAALIPVLCLLLVDVLSAHADDWPQFRGPNCSGISQTAANLPVRFSETENVAWAADVGDGVGCPIVVAGRSFVLGMTGDRELTLFAHDARTGDKLWQRSWDTGAIPGVHKTNSHASTTPAADADRCYFYFSTLGLITVDAKTGKDVWHQKLPTPFFVFKWGPAMSPVLYKDKLLFVQDDDLYPAFYAFDKSTGKILWKDDRSDMAVNYSHPVICSANGKDEIVVAGTGLLIGYDPETGKRLWHAKTLLRNIKTTPVCKGDRIYISLQSGGIANQWLNTADRSETGNNDGKLTKQEMQDFVGEQPIPDSFYQKTFDRGDLNKDGFLEGEELDHAFLHPSNFAGARHNAESAADEYVMALRGGGRGDVTKSHLLWKHQTKYTDHIVSPLVHQQQMFLLKGGGITTLFETGTGEPVRGAKRINNSSEYFASPILGDGKIYLAGENGVVLVLSADDYSLQSKNDMGDSIVGTPAIAGDTLFVRTRSKLLAIRKPQ